MAPVLHDADAVLVTGSRISAVGRTEELLQQTPAEIQKHDLGGRPLIPGFNDAHVHIWKVGQLLTSIADLRSVASFSELATQLCARATESEGKLWVMGRGVNELKLSEGRLPTRHDLDQFLPHRPVLVTRTCGHVAIANTRALEIFGIDTKTDPPPGGEIDREPDGTPNGVLKETAIALTQAALPQPTVAEYRKMIAAATQRQLSLGITAATDPGVGDDLLAAYRQSDEAGELTGRYNVMRLPDARDRTLSESPHLRVDTTKFFMDGGLSGATAALSQPYRHADTQGVLRLTTEQLVATASPLAANGWRIATHVIGDAAIEAALAAYAQLPSVESPHRFEHFGLPTAEHRRQAAELGIAVATQSIFLPELGGNFSQYLPADFPITPYPIRSMIAAGIVTALSSDAPVVVDDNPLAGMKAAVERLTASGELIDGTESIAVEAALAGYTRSGALLAGDEQNYGTIEVGKYADLVVLDRDPIDTPTTELTSIKVDMTFIGGSLVFER